MSRLLKSIDFTSIPLIDYLQNVPVDCPKGLRPPEIISSIEIGNWRL